MSYKTLALFVYHPAMQHILRLATMEIKNKSTHEITLFWELYNEILSDIKGTDYKFSPKIIMVSEDSANYCVIQHIFGVNFITSKVVSCQMHYRNDVNRVCFKSVPSYRDLFKSICHRMCFVATVAEYNKQKKWWDEIANIFQDIAQWITWWDARKYHVLPAFRCFGHSNVTLAKSGNAILMGHTQLWLLEAAPDDTSTIFTQINEFLHS